MESHSRLILAEQKLNTVGLSFHTLPVSESDPLWNDIRKECQLSLVDIIELKNEVARLARVNADALTSAHGNEVLPRDAHGTLFATEDNRMHVTINEADIVVCSTATAATGATGHNTIERGDEKETLPCFKIIPFSLLLLCCILLIIGITLIQVFPEESYGMSNSRRPADEYYAYVIGVACITVSIVLIVSRLILASAIDKLWRRYKEVVKSELRNRGDFRPSDEYISFRETFKIVLILLTFMVGIVLLTTINNIIIPNFNLTVKIFMILSGLLCLTIVFVVVPYCHRRVFWAMIIDQLQLDQEPRVIITTANAILEPLI